MGNDIRRRLRSLPERKASFIEPMECLAVTKLPEGPEWVHEIKFDGYRAIAVNVDGRLDLLSRRHKSFKRQFAAVAEALVDLPDNTVVDGEVMALDDRGRPNFNLLQHSRGAASRLHYFIFDLLVYRQRDLTRLPLLERREIMSSELGFRSPRIRIADYFQTSARDMVSAVREQGLEGVDLGDSGNECIWVVVKPAEGRVLGLPFKSAVRTCSIIFKVFPGGRIEEHRLHGES